MHLYSSLSRTDLESIAQGMGIALFEFNENGVGQRGKYAGLNRFRFMLRPLSGSDVYRLIRDNPYSPSGQRRVFAVCWHGHRDFMRRVFELDPTATFKTAVATWAGSVDFEDRHRDSAYRNIGSQVYPLAYADACGDGCLA